MYEHADRFFSEYVERSSKEQDQKAIFYIKHGKYNINYLFLHQLNTLIHSVQLRNWSTKH